jgi:type II secretory pathway pseudopilin PulG
LHERAPSARWTRVRRRSEGFTYAGILFAIVVLGLALSTAGTLWSAASQRQREAELLWVGVQYVRAIETFYLHAPGGARHYPRSLQDLVEDRRGPVVRRHLRKLYPDPVTGKLDWELEQLADGGIVGVRSRSTKQPFRRVGMGPAMIDFEKANSYGDWAFVYDPRLTRTRRPSPP